MTNPNLEKIADEEMVASGLVNLVRVKQIATTAQTEVERIIEGEGKK